MESSRLKVNRERIDASRNAEIGLAGLRTNDDRSLHRFVTAWPAHLVTVVKKRTSGTARCAVAEGSQALPH